ncbi:MAG: acyltransferase family protein [Lachnospiraceae bacterium]|nr:acyltransferase family protein [Lachnospiraceae bacterium]
MTMDTKRRTDYVYMEILRVLSAFAVIVIHVSGTNWSKLSIGDVDWTVRTFYNVGARFSLCVFCMITGALLLNPQKNIGIGEVYRRYVKRILICLVVWTVVYAILYTIMESAGDLVYFIKHLFVLPKHFWYLIMLVGLYLALPVLRVITANKNVTLYLIWILILFGMIFGTIKGTVELFKDVAEEGVGYQLCNVILNNLNDLNRTFVPGYLGCFLLGYYVHEHGLGKWSKLIVFMAIPSLLLSVALTILFSMITDSHVYTFMLETNPLIVLASVGIFEFFKGEKGKERVYDVNSRLVKWILFISGNTFGVYLSHLVIIKFVDRYFKLGAYSFPSIISVPLISLLVFLVAHGITVILKMIPLVKKTIT